MTSLRPDGPANATQAGWLHTCRDKLAAGIRRPAAQGNGGPIPSTWPGFRCATRPRWSIGRHYGLTIATCVPYDPASKGGSEATVKIAKADLVPAGANLRPAYASFAELESACQVFCGEVNARPHRITRRAPAEMLAEEQARLLTQAQADAGPARVLLAEATRAAASGRSPDGLIYHINLAIDYLDFAPADRRRRCPPRRRRPRPWTPGWNSCCGGCGCRTCAASPPRSRCCEGAAVGPGRASTGWWMPPTPALARRAIVS